MVSVNVKQYGAFLLHEIIEIVQCFHCKVYIRHMTVTVSS